MSAQHTPGPWTWFDYPDGRKLLAAPTRAVLHCPDAPMSCEPADRALIAAAPELYEAIKSSMEYLDATIGPCDADCECILHGLHAALAKAEGR